jgi:hypothetical protein
LEVFANVVAFTTEVLLLFFYLIVINSVDSQSLYSFSKSDFVSFPQVLMAEEKWNVLIGVTRSFCNESAHFYSKYLLPFTNYAQEILYKEA